MYAALRLFKQMCAALRLFKRVSGKSVKILSRYLANHLRVTQMSKAQSQAEKEDNSMCFHFERYTRTAGAEVNMKVYIEANCGYKVRNYFCFYLIVHLNLLNAIILTFVLY